MGRRTGKRKRKQGGKLLFYSKQYHRLDRLQNHLVCHHKMRARVADRLLWAKLRQCWNTMCWWNGQYFVWYHGGWRRWD